jgi:SAM-dependent methyltransferase
MASTVERFNDRVENYVKYRPGYPPEVLDVLRRECGLSKDDVVADVGSGTGISSRIFLENGNAAMTAAAVDQLAKFPWFIPVNGTAEATTLPEQSIDIVVSAQAFHWFEPAATRREFERILRPGGHIVLMWNERRLSSTPFLAEYEALLIKFGRDYEQVRHENIGDERLSRFFPGDYGHAAFENIQHLDFDGLKGRMLSSSYMPAPGDEVFDTMIGELQDVFAKHAESGRIKVFYDTNVYYSRV